MTYNFSLRFVYFTLFTIFAPFSALPAKAHYCACCANWGDWFENSHTIQNWEFNIITHLQFSN
jgi:hypothetical protein